VTLILVYLATKFLLVISWHFLWNVQWSVGIFNIILAFWVNFCCFHGITIVCGVTCTVWGTSFLCWRNAVCFMSGSFILGTAWAAYCNWTLWACCREGRLQQERKPTLVFPEVQREVRLPCSDVAQRWDTENALCNSLTSLLKWLSISLSAEVVSTWELWLTSNSYQYWRFTSRFCYQTSGVLIHQKGQNQLEKGLQVLSHCVHLCRHDQTIAF